MTQPFEFLKFTPNGYINTAIYTVLIFIAAFILLKILRAILTRFIHKSSGDLRVDPTQFKFLNNALGFVIYLIAILILFLTIPELEKLGYTLFASAGIIAAIVGFASQAAFSNIVSGIFIVIFKPFRVGDIVKISNLYSGVVEDITLRHTVIRDFENKRLIIPNSVISAETIHNANIIEERVCNHIFYGISYDSDINLATKIIQEEAMKHPLFMDNRTEEEKQNGNPAVIVRLLEFAESSIQLRAQVWTNDPIEGFELKCDINRTVKERFDREGIEIPFPYRTIVYKEKKEKKD
ncbi:mechanosensitive ion channel family protein [Roseivirga pacifica]|uniref:mechanosensitive ion channel family protein n=1 Tax=Roseivirga pacifica TaxID=1267423 RepID=UPI00227C9FFB|nr:mechanosensitive ion channel family protein [Roseivirga pacifica]